MADIKATLFKRLESEIASYLSRSIEISPGVTHSQYQRINDLITAIHSLKADIAVTDKLLDRTL